MPITYNIDIEAGVLFVNWHGGISPQDLVCHWDTLQKDNALPPFVRPFGISSMHRAFLHTVVAITCSIATSQGLPSQLNLGGFQLGQLISTAEKKFGKPFEVRTTPDDWLISAFWTSNKHEHLLAFECEGPDKNKISSIQLSGKPIPSIFGLAGVSLGASESDVIKALGPPSAKKTYEDDGIQYTKLEFSGKNYSLELNKEGLVISIKIIGFDGFPKKPTSLPTTEPLRKALMQSNLKAFELLLAPDFEIYRGDKIISYNGPATEDLISNSELREALIGGQGLKAALSGGSTEEDPQMRITAKGVSFHVVKYPKSPLLQEIVYTRYAGSWRIYEIKFKH